LVSRRQHSGTLRRRDGNLETNTIPCTACPFGSMSNIARCSSDIASQRNQPLIVPPVDK
jgi:hypothetical protein